MEGDSTVQFGSPETFDFTPPSGSTFFLWLISLLVVVYGLGISLLALIDNDFSGAASGGIFVVPGCLLGMYLTPTKLQKEYDKIRVKEKPRDFIQRKESGGRTGNFWTGKYSHSPKKDDRGWVFQAPGPEYWDKIDPYGPDDTGIIPEHPTVIGTPIPASFSLDGALLSIITLYSIPITMLSFYTGTGILESGVGEDEFLLGVALIFGPAIGSIIFAITMWSEGTKMQLTIDVPTSKIRSMAAGELELVGQVRRETTPAPPVQVGNDPARTYDDLHIWEWRYEIYLRRTRIVMTDKGPRTETEYRWETITFEKGGHNFILHDGTGGVVVSQDTFKEINLGDYIRIWEIDHNRNLGEIFGSIITTTFGGWTILKHKWTLWGLALGDPCYILGTAKNRPKKMLDPVAKKSSHQQTLMQVVGESGVRFNARLERGSELGVLGKVKSQIEYKLIPGILAIGCLIGTYLAYVNY